ncbi:MAG: M28 family peptidase [Pirellulaceae bacterium]
MNGSTKFAIRIVGSIFTLLLLAGAGCVPDGDTSMSIRSGVSPEGFQGDRAFSHLQAICELGPRVSGTPAMKAQRLMLAEHFRGLGAEVRLQDFPATQPLDGSTMTMTNMLVSWHPQKLQRVLLCTHFDTRPFPDRDPNEPQGEFLGANDGASGVALLMELGRHISRIDCRYGIDFVFFDGEELVYNERFDPYFLGSKHFARSYVNNDEGVTYQYGVLLDMVGDAQLQIYFEKNSFEKARPLTTSIWDAARRAGVAEFIPRVRHEVNDDHLPLNDIARIPTCDIIDFDYPREGVPRPYWHTRADTPQNCSGQSLAKVGRVLIEWLKTVE